MVAWEASATRGARRRGARPTDAWPRGAVLGYATLNPQDGRRAHLSDLRRGPAPFTVLDLSRRGARTLPAGRIHAAEHQATTTLSGRAIGDLFEFGRSRYPYERFSMGSRCGACNELAGRPTSDSISDDVLRPLLVWVIGSVVEKWLPGELPRGGLRMGAPNAQHMPR